MEEVAPGLFSDVKYYVVGEIDEKTTSLLHAGGAKKDTYLSESVSHVICDQCSNPEYGEAKDLFELPVVTPRWVALSVKCRVKLPHNAFDPESSNFFTKVVATCSGISKSDSTKLWALINLYGGKCQAKLNANTTHLITPAISGVKYDTATKKGVIVVCPDWILESVKRQKSLEVRPYHPKYLVIPASAEVDVSAENGGDKKTAPPTAILKKFKPSQRVTEELKAMRAMEEMAQSEITAQSSEIPKKVMENPTLFAPPSQMTQSDSSTAVLPPVSTPPMNATTLASVAPVHASSASAPPTTVSRTTSFKASFVGSDLDLMMEEDEATDTSLTTSSSSAALGDAAQPRLKQSQSIPSQHKQQQSTSVEKTKVPLGGQPHHESKSVSAATVSSTFTAAAPSVNPGDSSAGHDPNDDIAAAIAAVAAGESDLKMPSAAVEAEQVLSGQGTKFVKEKREGEDASGSQEPPPSVSSANTMPPPSDASFGNQGLPSQSVSPTGRGTTMMGFTPRSPRGRISPSRGARAKSPMGMRFPGPDNVRPMQPPTQQQRQSPDATKIQKEGDIMSGLMEGGSIGSMGMPAGGMVMSGPNALGTNVPPTPAGMDQRSVLAQALQKELPLQGTQALGPMGPRGPGVMGRGFGGMVTGSRPGMRMPMNASGNPSGNFMGGPGGGIGGFTGSPGGQSEGPVQMNPEIGGNFEVGNNNPSSSSPNAMSPVGHGHVSPGGSMSPGAAAPTSPCAGATTPRTKEVLARMVADRLNQQQQQQQQQQIQMQQQQQQHQQQQQQQMIGPGMGNINQSPANSMGPSSPQGGMLRGGPMMASRMELMNMQQQQHMQGSGPMAPGSPQQLNNMRGPMMRGPGPGMGGARMQQYPRGMMMQDGSPGMMGGSGPMVMGQMIPMNQGQRMEMHPGGGGPGGGLMFPGGDSGGSDPNQMIHGHPMGPGSRPQGMMMGGNQQMIGGHTSPNFSMSGPNPGMRMMGPSPSQPSHPNIMQGNSNFMGGQMMGAPSGPGGMMMQPGPHSGQAGSDQQVNPFPFYGHDPSENIPRDGCLLGCTFFIADYPTIVTAGLINAWVRVIREHGGQVRVDSSHQQSLQSKSIDKDVSNRENKSPNEKSLDSVGTKSDQIPMLEGTSSISSNDSGLGNNVDAFNPDVVTHLLCHTQKSDTYKRAIESRKVRCVTAYWLNDVLTHKKMSQPCTAIHLPVPFLDTQKPCRSHIIAVTNFEGYDRTRLKHMIQLVGAKYTGYLSRHNTVLVCGKPEGPKYQKAREWRIPVVSPQWLSDILLGDYQNARNPYDPKYKQYTVETRFYLNYFNVAPLMHAWRVPIKVSKEALGAFMQQRSESPHPPNAMDPSAAQLAEATANNARKAFRETVEAMAPETAKIKAEMAAKLKGGVSADKKRLNSEEEGGASKKLKLSSSDDQIPASAAEGGGGGGGGGSSVTMGGKAGDRDLNANQEIRVMFTNLDKEYVERLKPQLVAIGIEVTNNPVLATHVVTSKLRRTLKLIAAMNVCEYVVTPLWVEACLRQSKLLPVSDQFLLQDPEGESVYCCSIQESLKRKRTKSLFRGMTFWVSQSVIPERRCIRLLIEGAGGVVDDKRPSATKIAQACNAAIKGHAPGPSYLIITCENDLHLCRDLISKRVPLFNVEFVLTGIMRQEVDFRAYRIDVSGDSERQGMSYQRPLY